VLVRVRLPIGLRRLVPSAPPRQAEHCERGDHDPGQQDEVGARWRSVLLLRYDQLGCHERDGHGAPPE
jgi:hypothetical protein